MDRSAFDINPGVLWFLALRRSGVWPRRPLAVAVCTTQQLYIGSNYIDEYE